MAENSKIQWTDHTMNPWIGCTKVSVGELGACENCYAEVATPSRAMRIEWGAGKPRHRTSESTWAQPLRWERNAAAFFAEHGRRQRVFCASLADVFDNEVPLSWRADLFELIAKTPSLDWILLTKRIGNARRMLDMASFSVTHRLQSWGDGWRNVWLGATVANQEEAERDIPKLIATPARVRFLSCEPLLGPIDIGRAFPCGYYCDEIVGHVDHPFISRVNSPLHWIIVGGESGPQARRFDIGWARDLVRQCRVAGVAPFVKQFGAAPTWDGCASPDEHWPAGTEKHDGGCGYWEIRLRDRKGGDIAEFPPDLRVREFPATNNNEVNT